MRLILALAAILTLAVADAQAFGRRGNKGCSGGCTVSAPSTYHYTSTVYQSSGTVKTCNGTSCGVVTNTHQYTPLQTFQGKYIITGGCSNGSCSNK